MNVRISIGDEFGYWRVIGDGKKPINVRGRAKYFLCECQCPQRTQRMVLGRSLREGTSRSCGCIGSAITNCKDETGKEYGKWKVIRKEPRPPHRSGRGQYFLCECSCSHKTRRIISGNALRTNTSTNCGCEWRYAVRNSDAPFTMLLGIYSRNAVKRRKPFALTIADIKDLCQQECHYCGQRPSCLLKPFLSRNFRYNGIDRIDSRLGYARPNCVPCCKTCNTAKLSMTVDEFRDWIRRVYNRLCL